MVCVSYNMKELSQFIHAVDLALGQNRGDGS